MRPSSSWWRVWRARSKKPLARRWCWKNGDEVAAEESCERCEAGIFHWESRCPSCGATVATSAPAPRDDADAIGERLVAALVDHGHMTLRPKTRPAIERFVSAYLDNFRPSAAALASALMEQPEVMDLFCDDETLASLVQRARRPKATPSAAYDAEGPRRATGRRRAGPGG